METLLNIGVVFGIFGGLLMDTCLLMVIYTGLRMQLENYYGFRAARAISCTVSIVCLFAVVLYTRITPGMYFAYYVLRTMK